MQATPHLLDRPPRPARYLALALVASGILVLLGWLFDISLLKSVLPGLVYMHVNTAVLFLLCGLAVLLEADRRQGAAPGWLGRTLAVLVGAVALVTLGEYASAWNVGVHQWLAPGNVESAGASVHGRMALMTAVDFLLLAAALLLINVETPRGRRPSNWLALAVAGNAFLAVMGYLYDVTALYRLAAWSAMALHTALLFLVASAALPLLRPGSRFVRQILQDNAAGLVARRLLPAAILVPAMLGWLALQGESVNLYDDKFRLALIVVGNVAILTTVIWCAASSTGRLQESQRRVSETSAWQHAMINSANFTVISTDRNGLIRTINAGAASKLGYAPEELVGIATPAIIHDPGEVEARAEALSRELGYPVQPGFEAFVAKARTGVSDENDWTYIHKDGSRLPVRLSVTAMTDSSGAITGYLGVSYDITLQREAEAGLHRLAKTDALTGLANRREFEERLRAETERCSRTGQAMALLFLDLDNFKGINDSLGHHCGDLVLKEFARRLVALVREHDTVARLAGDEFVIILAPLRDPDVATHVADKIVDAMRHPFQLPHLAHPVSTSIGIALYQRGDTGERLLGRADKELYKAKARGGGRCSLDPGETPRAVAEAIGDGSS